MIFADRLLKYCYKKNIEFIPGKSVLIDAKTIRDILTSLTPDFVNKSSALRMRGDPAGEATIYIVGILDLKDGFGIDGGTMPAFVATNCRFVMAGDAGTDPSAWPLAQIEMARANFDRLSLRGSAFRQLRANNCFIDGDCDLGVEFGSKAARLAPCHVRLDGAEITGSLYLSGRRFQELPRDLHVLEEKSQRPPYYRNCALDLSNAKIGRDVQIVRPEIIGLLNGRGIMVEGSIRMMAVTARPMAVAARARSGKAIDFQYARVSGNLSIKAALDSLGEPCSSISGALFLNAARVGGDLIVKEGCFRATACIQGVGAGDSRKTAIDLRDVIVGGNVHVGADAEDDRATFICGAIVLDYAVIGGGLQFDRVEAIESVAATPHCNLQARGITVKQNLAIQSCRWVADPAESGIQFCALDLWKCTVGLGVKVDQRTTIRGSIRINNADIARGMMIRANFIGQCGPSDRRGDTIDTRIDLAGTRIDGDLRINAGAQVNASATSGAGMDDGADRDAGIGADNWSITIDGAVSLNQTIVSGRTVLENLQFQYPALPNEPCRLPLDAEQRDRRERDRLSDNRRTIINLNGLEARGGLIVRNLSWRVWRNGTLFSPKPAPDPYPPMKIGRLLPIRRDLILDAGLAIIDARGMQSAFLNDDHGAAWQLHLSHYLKLDQIDVGRIEEDEGHHLNSDKRLPFVESHQPKTTDRKMRLRLMFLAHQATRINILATNRFTPFIWWRTRFFTSQPFDNMARAYIRRGDLPVGRKLLIRRTDIEHWRRSREILIGRSDAVLLVARQVASLFGPLWHAARIYRITRKKGIKAALKIRRRLKAIDRLRPEAIAVELYGPPPPKKSLTTICKERTIAALHADLRTITRILAYIRFACGFMLGALYVILFKMFRWMFGYGLEPGRAVLTMLGFILLGWFGAFMANGRTIGPHWPPVSDSDLTRAALIKALPDWPGVDVTFAGIAIKPKDKRKACDIDSLSYAVDTFIPLLDMNFEAACKIADDPMLTNQTDPYRGWRWTLLMYEIAGWIVTSLTILTISGVIRRDVDK